MEWHRVDRDGDGGEGVTRGYFQHLVRGLLAGDEAPAVAETELVEGFREHDRRAGDLLGEYFLARRELYAHLRGKTS